jgi:aryl-alcohol dehydrogenase-like predicted oxidoreductase
VSPAAAVEAPHRSEDHVNYRLLGRTGLRVSDLGLGTMMFGAWGNQDHDECVTIIDRALDAGINLVDTADVYAFGETEEIVGRALKGKRDQVVLATKFWNGMGEGPNERGASRRWIMQAVEASLRRLDTDWIDLYQVHRPDFDVEMDELVDALSDLVHQGKIRYWGTSTWPSELIVEGQWAAQRRSAVRAVCEQPPYSIFARGVEAAALPTCRRHGIGVVVWSPLNGGWLTGKYRKGQPIPTNARGSTHPDHFAMTDAKVDAVEQLVKVADELGVSMTHMALAWVREHPAVACALIGPKTLPQVDDLLAVGELRLPAWALDRIDEIVPPGTTFSDYDLGWEPWGLQVEERRRPA